MNYSKVFWCPKIKELYGIPEKIWNWFKTLNCLPKVVEEHHVQQPTYYIVQQPGHSVGDHDYSEEVDQTENQVYTEEVQNGNQVYTEEVEQTENHVVADYKTEYKIVTEGIKTPSLPVSSTDNLGRQFGPRSGQTKRWV